jgi:asparagine synthase (glutamine-hydrolysing)
MPGISGFVHSSALLDNPDEILGMFEQVHSLKGVNFVQRTFRSNQCVITNTLTGLLKTTLDQPASDPAGNTFLFLEGEVYNTEELLNHLNGPQDLSPCHVLLALFLEHGPDFVSLVNGDFNIVIYQKAEKRLIILNDYLSSKPMYYLEQADSLLFGSEKKSILAVASGSPAIDPIGLLQVFAHRHNLGGRTFIKGLKRLSPGSRLDYHRGRLDLTRYHLLTSRMPEVSSKVDSLLDEWCDRLRQVTIRRLKGRERVVMFLSGGLDSRAIACAIPRDFRPIWARTWGETDSLEAIYATKIAERLNFDHYCEDPMAVPLSSILHKIVWRTECETHFTNCISMANHPMIKEHGDFVLGGHLGDVSAGGHIYPYMFLPRSRQQFIARAYRWNVTYSFASLSELFNEEFLHKNFPGLKDAFFASFDPLEGETNIHVYEVWDLYERQARMTFSSGATDSHLFEQIRPFYDRDYMDFVTSLPTRLRFGQTLYQAMIYRLGPEIRDIPNANTNLNLHSTIWGNILSKGLTLGLKARTKLLRKIRPSYQSKTVREDTTLATRQDPEFRRIIENSVRLSYLDSSIFNGPGIMRMLDRQYQGVADHTNPLCILATFAVGLPYFVYSRPCHCPREAEPMS